jgi:hypothetical protein
MSGRIAIPSTGWIELKLAKGQDVISGFIGGVRIFEIQDPRYPMGHIGIGSSFHPIAFDDLRIRDAH